MLKEIKFCTQAATLAAALAFAPKVHADNAPKAHVSSASSQTEVTITDPMPASQDLSTCGLLALGGGILGLSGAAVGGWAWLRNRGPK